MIAVTFALPTESADFISRLDAPSRGTTAHTITARYRARDVCILHTGVGESLTRQRLGAFLERQRPHLLIASGFAGALGDDWHPADVFLAANVCTAAVPDAARQRFRNARLASAASIVDSSAERRSLARRTGAAAVDMETEIIAELCEAASVPLLVLRAVSDTANAPLPAPPRVLFDLQRQKTRLSRLALYILRHPGALPRLIAFARQVRQARRALATALVQLLDDLPALR